MKNINTIHEKGLSFLWREKVDGSEHLKFKSKKDLHLKLNDTIDQILLLMSNGPMDSYFVVHKVRVIEMVENEDGFTYIIDGKINYLSKWEFNLVKKQHIKNDG